MVALNKNEQTMRQIMTHCYALSDIPSDIRETMQNTWAKWDLHDLTLDGTLALIHNEPLAVQQVGVLSRSVANRSRVPALCDVVHQGHRLSWRVTWRVVGLFLGLHPSHVQRLCYRRQQ